MLIVGEISSVPGYEEPDCGGYDIVCSCGAQITVPGQQEIVRCANCGKTAELIELVAGWWRVSDWHNLRETVIPPETLSREHLRTSGGRPRWPSSRKLTGQPLDISPPEAVASRASTLLADSLAEEYAAGFIQESLAHGDGQKKNGKIAIPGEISRGTARLSLPDKKTRRARALDPSQPVVTSTAQPDADEKKASDNKRARDMEIFQLLLTRGHEQSIPSGTVILREGTAGDCMFALKSGIVELTARDQLLDILEPGAVFGEMSLLDGKPRSATAKATTNCSIVMIDDKAFMDLARDHLEFVVYLLRTMSDRVRRLNDIATTLMSISPQKF